MTDRPSSLRWPTIIGHRTQRDRLKTLWEKGRVPSALLFAGSQGIGKRLVAEELYRSVLCQSTAQANGIESAYGGCGQCPTCTLLLHGTAPDLHCIDAANKESGSLDAFRDLLHSLHLKAFKGGARAVIIDNSDVMSQQIANLLLKIVEEPSDDLYFCLLAANPSRLPRTLLSRCQMWHFHRLSKEELGSISRLRSEDPSPQTHSALSEGVIESEDTLEALTPLYTEAREALCKIYRGEASKAATFADTLKSQKDKTGLWLRALRTAARQLLHEAVASNDVVAIRRWSEFVRNTVAAETLLFERHLAPFVVFQVLLTGALPRASRAAGMSDGTATFANLLEL